MKIGMFGAYYVSFMELICHPYFLEPPPGQLLQVQSTPVAKSMFITCLHIYIHTITDIIYMCI